jgi:WD40 repeat protein
MSLSLTCPNGHRWDPTCNGTATLPPGDLACPECGAVVPFPVAAILADAPRPDAPPNSGSATFLTGGALPVPADRVIDAAPPGYEVLGELGRGGMGVVYKARQLALRRIVALKMVLTGAHAGEDERTRFRTEAEAVARLQHANIVQIYEIGEHQGRPYFALEFCAGGSLDRKLRGTPLPPREAASLVETIARAMHTAHRQQVIHRDLKPANVLLLEDGTPKISDFGLAKKLDDAGQTQSGAIMGTPSYMAPEQAAGGVRHIGPAADVYSLGAVLYDLLTGRPPFKAATAMDTIMQVLHEEPVRPSQLQPRLPRDLDTIVLKCLQKEPRKRYASAADLADDLKRWLDGEPIAARPVGLWERAAKWVRRRPTVAALLALLMVTTTLGFGLVTWKWLDADRARAEAAGRADEATRERTAAVNARTTAVEQKDRADKERRRAEDQLARAEAVLYLSRIGIAQRDWLAGETDKTEAILNECRLDLRGWEWRFLRRALTTPPTDWPGVTKPVAALAFDPTGPRVVVAAVNGVVTIRDAAGAEVAVLKGHEGPVFSAAFRRDGKRVATAGADETARIWNVETGELLHTLKSHTAVVQCVAFAPDGKTLVSGSRDATAVVWDAETGAELRTLGGHSAALSSVSFSSDGERLATACYDKTVKIWDPRDGKLLRTFRGHSSSVLSVAFRPRGKEDDGRQIASAGLSEVVLLWNAETGEMLRSLRSEADEVAFSPDGSRLVTLTPKQITLWAPNLGQPILTLDRPKDAEFGGLAFGSGGNLLGAGWSAGKNGGVRLWDGAPGNEAFQLRSRGATIADVAFSADGQWIATAETLRQFLAGRAVVWDAATAQETHALHGHLGSVVKAAFSPDGKRLATGSSDCTLMLWDPATGKQLDTLVGHTGAIVALAFSPDGRRLVSASFDRTVRLWDVTTAKELQRLKVERIPTAAAFCGDALFAAASVEGPVQIWDAATGKPFRTLPGRQTLSVSPDGKRLATAGPENTIKIYEVVNGVEVRSLPGAEALVLALAFSPDGRFLASAGVQDGVRVWDVAGGKASVQLDKASARAAAFSPNGRLASVVEQRVRVWERSSWTLDNP